MKRTLLTFILFLAAAAAWAGDPYIPTDAERANWTLADMRTWHTALDAYAVDHNTYPDAKTLEELRDAVQPMYIAHAPMHDAWGNPYHYEKDPVVGFRLVSSGADGKFDPQSWTVGGKRSSYDDDAVVTAKDRFWFRWWEFK